MPLGDSLPYGLRDIKIWPITNAGTLGTAVDLPNARTLSFEESEDFDQHSTDDLVARGLRADFAVCDGRPVYFRVWEPIAGFSRAVRVKDTIRVSGTTATRSTTAWRTRRGGPLFSSAVKERSR